MRLRLLYFASLREQLGCGEEYADLPPEVRTVRDVRNWLAARGGAWAEALAPGRLVRTAQNQCLVTEDAMLEDGAELALFPPVTGG